MLYKNFSIRGFYAESHTTAHRAFFFLRNRAINFLHNIIKMPYFTSEVGYKFDASYQHHGYAREALSMALSVGFYGLGLHKIFARCMPENTPSKNLLHATGFFEEGIERDSILIQGKWEDHIRYAILNPDEIHS